MGSLNDINVGIISTVVGTIIVTIILGFNAFIWNKRYWIKVKIKGGYERLFSKVEESKYTVGAAEYIKTFRKWEDKQGQGLSLIFPYFHRELTYNNVTSVQVLRNRSGAGHVIEIIFREDSVPKSKYIFGITDEEVAKVARRLYFQGVIGKHER